MGFGSYDESEQDSQQISEDDLENAEEEDLRDSDHDGELEFEMEDTESAIEKLQKIQEEESEE